MLLEGSNGVSDGDIRTAPSPPLFGSKIKNKNLHGKGVAFIPLTTRIDNIIKKQTKTNKQPSTKHCSIFNTFETQNLKKVTCILTILIYEDMLYIKTNDEIKKRQHDIAPLILENTNVYH